MDVIKQGEKEGGKKVVCVCVFFIKKKGGEGGGIRHETFALLKNLAQIVFRLKTCQSTVRSGSLCKVKESIR